MHHDGGAHHPWSGDAFDAQISSVDLNSKVTLPNLYGPGGSEQTALQGYRNMQSLLETSNLYIVEMFLSERFAWNVQLNNGIKLNLGRTEFIDRLQRFVDLYHSYRSKTKKSIMWTCVMTPV